MRALRVRSELGEAEFELAVEWTAEASFGTRHAVRVNLGDIEEALAVIAPYAEAGLRRHIHQGTRGTPPLATATDRADRDPMGARGPHSTLAVQAVRVRVGALDNASRQSLAYHAGEMRCDRLSGGFDDATIVAAVALHGSSPILNFKKKGQHQNAKNSMKKGDMASGPMTPLNLYRAFQSAYIDEAVERTADELALSLTVDPRASSGSSEQCPRIALVRLFHLEFPAPPSHAAPRAAS